MLTEIPSYRALRVAAADNVATVVGAVPAGACVQVTGAGDPVTVQVRSDVPFGHKFALEPIPVGGVVRKYGQPIGHATAAVQVGEHVHVHNVVGERGRKDKRQLGNEGELQLLSGGGHC